MPRASGRRAQFQMQSGTTGINATRIYSPAKQAEDHAGPDFAFIRRWVPELSRGACADGSLEPWRGLRARLPPCATSPMPPRARRSASGARGGAALDAAA
eukprot:3858864-Prymnesium_polylepis.1